jgi:hypothetical protein
MIEPTVPPDTPAPSRFRRSVPPARRRRTIYLATVLLAFLGIGAAWYFGTAPGLVFTNELAGPIRLAADQATPLTLAPGETVRVRVPRNRSMVALWELVRPLTADGRPMGTEVRGSVVVRAPDGTMHRSARARGTDADYFAPLITNATEDLLRVRVNAGLEGSLDCGCAVRPGATRVFIGYYPLYQNSTVRAAASDGRSATFRDLGSRVTRPDGTVGLRFEAGDLR